MGLTFRELCRWEVGVRLGWLPTTRRHLDWITWSLRWLEERVELQKVADYTQKQHSYGLFVI